MAQPTLIWAILIMAFADFRGQRTHIAHIPPGVFLISPRWISSSSHSPARAIAFETSGAVNDSSSPRSLISAIFWGFCILTSSLPARACRKLVASLSASSWLPSPGISKMRAPVIALRILVPEIPRPSRLTFCRASRIVSSYLPGGHVTVTAASRGSFRCLAGCGCFSSFFAGDLAV